MTFFLSHRPGFSDFPFLFPDFTMLNVVYDPFLTRKHFFKLFSYIRQHYLSKYWGDGCMGRPPTSNLGGVPPVPLGLRPWFVVIIGPFFQP